MTELIWRRILDEASFEHARLTLAADRILIDGTVLIAEEGAPLRVDYRVTCGPDWSARRVEITQSFRGEERWLSVAYEGESRWSQDSVLAPGLEGCTDIDLGVSPSTNALPINRLGLAIGERRTITAAWVQFPSLEVVRAAQVYERLGARQYRYSSGDGSFTAVLDVDESGLPLQYGDIWRRIAG